MASTTTIQDLPDDMLHEIFGHVLAEKQEGFSLPLLFTDLPAAGAHLALRCVCRRWRDIADWVKLSTSRICVVASELADPGAVRARHPAAFKYVSLGGSVGGHSTSVSRVAATLIDSADVRRALVDLSLDTCCLPALLPAVTPISSCTALTTLQLVWNAHRNERVVPSNVLAPLSALRMLETLVYGHRVGDEALPKSAMLAPLPALPDVPRLTCFTIKMTGNFVPVGSDAALGRLRRLELVHEAPVRELVDAEDPFLLRTAFDAGTWQPSRLTGLQELFARFRPVRGSRAPVRRPRTGSRPGSEWASLAGQVTQLIITVESGGFNRPSTGIVAGLGVLTALRYLRFDVDSSQRNPFVQNMVLELASLDRMRAPNLTTLLTNCVSTPVDAARFPNLVYLLLASITRQPPLNLRSLAARSSLKTLKLAVRLESSSTSINLAVLFVGGAGWPVLEKLWLLNTALEWDVTGLVGAPTAPEFAGRARQLLPAVVRVIIEEPRGRNALPDRSRLEFVLACRRHVVPALKGLDAGGG